MDGKLFNITYGPEVLVLGWLLSYFPETHTTITLQTLFHPTLAWLLSPGQSARTFPSCFYITTGLSCDLIFLVRFEQKSRLLFVSISVADFAYLVVCCPSILIYGVVIIFMTKSIVLLTIADSLGTTSSFLGQPTCNFKLARAYQRNIHWRRINSTLEVPTCYLVRNVSVVYARWWNRIADGTCTIHLSALLPPSGNGQKRRDTLASKRLEDPSLFEKPSTSRVERRRGGIKQIKAKKDKKPPSPRVPLWKIGP